MSSVPNFVKIRYVGDKLFHADRRTDMAKLRVALRDFANRTRHVHGVIGSMNAFPVTCHPRAAEVHVGFQYPDALDGHF